MFGRMDIVICFGTYKRCDLCKTFDCNYSDDSIYIITG